MLGFFQTHFEDGEVVLTSHRLFWGRTGEFARSAVTLCLHLKYIVSVSEETASSYIFGRKTRLILHLRPPDAIKSPGPMDTSVASHIKLSGKSGLSMDFSVALRETVEAKIWDIIFTPVPPVQNTYVENKIENIPPRIKLRTGIGGIERSIEAKNKLTDQSIALAFQDLKVLMSMAQDMVAISKIISIKIREKKGDISEDETVRFKSYLMSLGIDDPVTRDNFTSNTQYFKSLAQQICQMLIDPIEVRSNI